MLINFKIRGNLRFLSHAEMVSVFQRACIRAGIKLRYSQGFNPRPKLSLPVPRSVGVESDDEWLCLRVHGGLTRDDEPNSSASRFEAERFKAELSKHLPAGCQLLSVKVARAGTSFKAIAATYVLPIKRRYCDEKLRTRIKRVLASEELYLQRRTDEKGGVRTVNVREFLKSMEFDDNDIVVECKISPAGTMRVDEILQLLELDAEKLAAPVRRTKIEWQSD